MGTKKYVKLENLMGNSNINAKNVEKSLLRGLNYDEELKGRQYKYFTKETGKEQ